MEHIYRFKKISDMKVIFQSIWNLKYIKYDKKKIIINSLKEKKKYVPWYFEDIVVLIRQTSKVMCFFSYKWFADTVG